ncbi:MAG: TlpA family protein disulfide reductase [Acidimicrobiales bacterium]
MGVGAQDDLALAEQFIERTGIESFTMLWDPGFESWLHYGIQVNSEVWLLDTNGNRVGNKFFALDEGTIDDLMAQIT